MTDAACRELYLNLLKRVLVDMFSQETPTHHWQIGEYQFSAFIPKRRELGLDVPSKAHSMIGLRRMDNIQMCIEQVLRDQVPGDLIETGVWRGGATIFMRGVLAAHNITDRVIWVADSFAGLPAPDLEKHPVDAFWAPMTAKFAVPVEEVSQNFARYGLLDSQVKFLKGWFKDSLAGAPIEQLAVLRMDGDLYESTWDVLSALYDKVAPGGFVIVDDYNLQPCRDAIHDYRAQHGIQEPVQKIDHCGVYWRRDF